MGGPNAKEVRVTAQKGVRQARQEGGDGGRRGGGHLRVIYPHVTPTKSKQNARHEGSTRNQRPPIEEAKFLHDRGAAFLGILLLYNWPFHFTVGIPLSTTQKGASTMSNITRKKNRSGAKLKHPTHRFCFGPKQKTVLQQKFSNISPVYPPDHDARPSLFFVQAVEQSVRSGTGILAHYSLHRITL